MDWNARITAAMARDGRIPDDDVVEELAQHARAMYDAARAEGASDAEAQARVGDQIERWRQDVDRLRHTSRRPAAVEPPPASSVSPLAGLGQDVRYAFRLLRRQPRFTLLASATMALGIAATTVLFSVTYGVLMKPLPWRGADRLVVLKETRGGRPPRFNAFSNAAYLAWREQATMIEDIAAWSQRTVTLTGQGEPERVRVTAATASLFTLLEAHPLLGSLFTEADEVAKNGNVVVLSESLWRERYGADPGVLGRALQFDGRPVTIVGVLPERLAYPDHTSRAWVPFHVPLATGNYLSMFNAVAKLRPGVGAAQAAAEGTARGRFVADTGMTTMAIFGSSGPVAIAALPMKDALTADVRQPLIVLLAAVGLLLVTAAANVAGLQLARATSRRREIAIRAALGAGSVRVIRQLLAESVLLGMMGAAAGLALTRILHGFMPIVLPADFPRAGDLHLDVVVVAFALLTSGLVSIAFGLLPALRMRRVDLVASLSEDGSAPVGVGAASRVGRARMLIMSGQVAIACVLLIGASLLGRSFLALLTADRGYDPSGVMTARVSLPDSMFRPERRYQIARQVLDRLSAMPGVSDAAVTSELPLTPGGSTAAFTLHGPSGPVSVQASPRVVSARSFSALGMRVIAGRGFSDSDTESSPPVAAVNRLFANRYLHGNAIGARIPMGIGYMDPDSDATIVGVVDDVRYLATNDSTQAEVYYSYRQLKGRLIVPVLTLLVRTPGDPAALAGALRSAVREADGMLVSESVMTMEDRMLAGLARPRLYTIVLGGFAVFALAIAAVGLFGALSYAVAQRSREIAVRSALGARPSQILQLVVRQGLTIALAGIVVGVLAAVVLARSMATFLYGVTPHDAVTFVSVPLLLLAVTAIACFIPARRAARLDPLRVLRSF
jgi:putative ABC transport system permease protein